MKQASRRLVFSGIQPTGIPHLGNYLGALREWSAISRKPEYEADKKFFSLMNLHALTVPRPADDLRRDVFDGACTLLACGIQPRPGQCSLFVQSDVRQHTELCWYLLCVTKLGQLFRMTQFKDKSASRGDSAETGLLVYPVLMAADILLYRASHVPVGDDQVQHLELTRDICDQFNRHHHIKYFSHPATVLRHDTKRIMSLTEPSKKMSKSEPKKESRVLLTDSADVIRKKIAKATTDSLGNVDAQALEKRPGVSNLISLWAACEERSEDDVRKEAHGMSMVTLKARVADATIQLVDPIRAEIERYRSDKSTVISLLDEGRKEAEAQAEQTMVKVRQIIGLDHLSMKTV